ncbi:hypothetical protein [Anaerobacillus alkalilacustris]|uniref:hypothetical protein n=1 Tax=Anaerobacillus alkalilacustris TaxID=393763 RepID=UPI001470B01E|nr:hypothetical protein [Anaerobacillus alkalilacustris]
MKIVSERLDHSKFNYEQKKSELVYLIVLTIGPVVYPIVKVQEICKEVLIIGEAKKM